MSRIVWRSYDQLPLPFPVQKETHRGRITNHMSTTGTSLAKLLCGAGYLAVNKLEPEGRVEVDKLGPSVTGSQSPLDMRKRTFQGSESPLNPEERISQDRDSALNEGEKNLIAGFSRKVKERGGHEMCR